MKTMAISQRDGLSTSGLNFLHYPNNLKKKEQEEEKKRKMKRRNKGEEDEGEDESKSGGSSSAPSARLGGERAGAISYLFG